ncbi:uncharacterized protein PAN0_007d3206 [Moesziomyces antarcticus]|uniref:Uncharacterized protein n=2 Tax=Pseudozyma antarctica TaxID=84753 RepID=A0A081CE94_PSEA2|nr:uncharacterized protein PAN0_007d3206 [Moesziomyces antarcticus]GAK64990.1 conserved hypothetical protein [Moesziomyces antarcticus]SPO46021.1 uncharacterized protein PSANT_03707 [Moesziomyces antarcticus]
MGLINLLLKSVILLLDLRDTYDALGSVKLAEIGNEHKMVIVRNVQDGSRQAATRRRVGTSKRKAAVRSALTTILVWNLFHKLEPVCDRTVSWFVPFYDSFKTLFLVWMLFTRSYGASILVYRFLAPLVRPYEHIIDASIGITLALFSWIASLLAPVTESCTTLLHGIISAAPQSAQRRLSMTPLEPPLEAKADSARSTSKSPKAKSKRRPPSPPPPSQTVLTHSKPAAPGQIAASKTARQTQPGPVVAKRLPTKKTSSADLAAKRRILQELPVPSHAFEPQTPDTTPASQTLSTGAPVTGSPSTMVTAVKEEPIDTSMGLNTASSNGSGLAAMPLSTVPADAKPEPPPTPPTGLQNYAFIPGVTPQRSGPSAVISPTPRFPGGFAFSFAASQASTSTSSNPFQLQPRLPATAQMAPLSLSSSQGAPPVLPLGANNVALTHETVASAHDDRIVPPPGSAKVIRKTPSSGSLKSNARAIPAPTVPKSTIVANGKKRSRAKATEDADTDGPTKSDATKPSPRKRSKPAPGASALRKASATGDPATAKSKRAPTSTSVPSKGKAAVQTSSAKEVAAKKVAAHKGNGKSSGAKADQDPVTTEGKPGSNSSGSPRKKPINVATTTGITSTKPSRVVKKVSAVGKPAADKPAESTPPAEEPPPTRLTRSRTRQHLAD